MGAFFVGTAPSGVWVVVCEAFRDEGVAPTGGVLAFVAMQGNACHLWEPRPRGDGWWSARLVATRASLLQNSVAQQDRLAQNITCLVNRLNRRCIGTNLVQFFPQPCNPHLQ